LFIAALGARIKEGGCWHNSRPHWQSAARTSLVASSSSQASQGTPSTCSPSIITLSHIDSLKDLAEAISRSKPKDTSAPGQQGIGVQVILEVDLNGKTLGGPDLSSLFLLIPRGLKLQLSNGSLHIPGHLYVLVGPGAVLEAVRVEFRGSGQYWRGLITVEGEGASANLHQCIITGNRDGSNEDRGHGLMVAGGGSVLAASTMVQHCGEHGFYASSNGKLVAERSIAHSNRKHGFSSRGSGVLEAGAGCRSELNGEAGFAALYGGQLVAGEGCYAGGNKGDGYCSSESGGRLHAGAGCIAEHNDSSGFAARFGGHLEAGAACIAAHNQGAGFLATWHSQLHAARGCAAIYNADAGFEAEDDAELTAGPGCKAEGNGRSHDDDWVQVPAGLLVRQCEQTSDE
jgi:hypothetical protein